MKNKLSSAIITIKSNKKEKIFIDSYFDFKKVQKDKDFCFFHNKCLFLFLINSYSIIQKL